MSYGVKFGEYKLHNGFFFCCKMILLLMILFTADSIVYSIQLYPQWIRLSQTCPLWHHLDCISSSFS